MICLMHDEHVQGAHAEVRTLRSQVGAPDGDRAGRVPGVQDPLLEQAQSEAAP